VSITIRPATTSDLEFIIEMLLEAMNWDPTRPPATLAQIRESPAIWHYVEGWLRPTDFGCVALDQSRPIGVVWARILTAEDPGYGYVRDDIPELSMGVVASHRGRGVGKQLLDEVISVARTRGLSALSLSVEDGNSAARRLYESRGFRVVGRVGNSDTLLLELT
jgi:ribosomal protein S18 acetylase RimI-like enzyme